MVHVGGVGPKATLNTLLYYSGLRSNVSIESRSSMIKMLCNRVILIIFDNLSKEYCIAAYLFAKTVVRMVQLHTALYLKQASTCLQQAYGGIPHVPGPLPVPISLTRSGYPTIIPAFHRKIMRQKDSRADKVVQLWLSFFTLAKIIKIAAKIRANSAFASIREPWKSTEKVMGYVGFLKEWIPVLTHRYLPSLRSIPLQQGIHWRPTWKATPGDVAVRESIRKTGGLIAKLHSQVRNSPEQRACY